MIPLTLIQIILIGILAVSVFLAVLHLVNAGAGKTYFAGRFIWLIDLTVLFLYGVCCLIIGLIYVISGYNHFVIYSFLVIGVGILLGVFMRWCFKNKNTMSRKHTAFFMIYFGVILYATLFTRIGSSYTGVQVMPFNNVKRASAIGDAGLLNHMFLNVLLFVPFGYLIPSMNPSKLRKWSVALLGGVMVSTIIEGIQLTAHLGECDLDDIIANTLGSVVGYILMRFVWRVNKNWKI